MFSIGLRAARAVAAIINLAHSLRLKVMVEGV